LQKKNEVLDKLDEAITLIDKIESFLGRVKPGDNVQPGILYQIYESLMLLREKIVETRLMVLQEESG